MAPIRHRGDHGLVWRDLLPALASVALVTIARRPNSCQPWSGDVARKTLGGRWRLHVAYDGTDYCGWQRQAAERLNVRTVQGTLERALAEVFQLPKEVTLKTVGSSRTDKGAHARGMVCHFDIPAALAGITPLEPETVLRRLRRKLPKSLFAAALGHADPNFHARLSALRKQYSYSLATTPASPFEARFCWECGPIDIAAVQAAASKLDGLQLDYSVAYTASGAGPLDLSYYGSPEKVVSLALRQESRHRVLITLSTEKFLYKMCRRIVGALVEAGRGRLAPESLADVARAVVPTAPASGLSLDHVAYPACFTKPRRPDGEEHVL